MLTTLKIMKELSRANANTIYLCALFNISPATLKREIAMARHLGAIIKSKKIKHDNGSIFVYNIENWEKCKNRTESWIELEKSKTVINSLQ